MIFFTERRRKRLRETPLPAALLVHLERNVPAVARLSPEDQAELRGHVQVFLDEKTFEGCGGLEMTDEIRVTIAAQACILLLHRDTDYYPDLRTIMVYPAAYVAVERRVDGGVVIEREVARAGESWTRGVVVLSWDDVLKGARRPDDGHNVVLHEFAHQLDQEDGDADGAPVLSRRGAYAPWASVLGAEFHALQRAERRHEPTVLDTYGAQNPAEFFAVATETFFERPETLRRLHPELYEQLVAYYKQDPASRGKPPRA
jgi:MtfA peptidase